MSTAEKKTGQLGSWANLVICGGLSWGVNFWHATHATSGDTKVGTWLALLCATGPVFSAGFASHNMSRSGGGSFKKFLTYLVFGMGMALSITAQAEAVTAVFGNIYLGVTFALMLDLSAFMSLHSIMSAPSVERSQDQIPAVPGPLQNRSQDRIESGPQDHTGVVPGPVPATVQDRSQDHSETVLDDTQDRSPKRSQDRRKTAPKASAKTPQKGRVTQAEWENKIRQAVTDHPGIDLNPSPIAAVLGLDQKTRNSGGFKRAVTAVREETDSADGRLRAVNE
jgi:hypothetical protein